MYVSTLSSILALVGGAVLALSQAIDVWHPFKGRSYEPATCCISRLIHDGEGIYTLRVAGTVGVEYFLEATTSLMPPEVWAAVPGSTHFVTEAHGQWEVVVTADEADFWFFRLAMAAE